jgi:hypothetical protein
MGMVDTRMNNGGAGPQSVGYQLSLLTIPINAVQKAVDG